jgi:D-serine deaminase-like pyridoxal phosphate-dependent protein
LKIISKLRNNIERFAMFTEFRDIDTPALLIEKNILENNISRMQTIADSNSIKLRPHIKTHKMPRIAEIQLRQGACGIAVAKLSEAETIAAQGFQNIQVANIIAGEKKISRLLDLSEKIDWIASCVDSLEGAAQTSKVFEQGNNKAKLYIEIDSGLHRSGLSDKEEIIRLAKFITDCPGLELVGILTHAGHAYYAENPGELEAIGKQESDFMVGISNELQKKGISISQVSVGSTPTAPYSSKIPGVSELRAGNYVFHDMIQCSIGSAMIEDCSRSVLSTVISNPVQNRTIIDAGSKALGLDMGAHGKNGLDSHGYIYGKQGKISRLSEEHGIIEHNSEKFRYAEKLRIIPNHACAVVNLYDKAYLVDGKKVIDEFNINCRGKMQ